MHLRQTAMLVPRPSAEYHQGPEFEAWVPDSLPGLVLFMPEAVLSHKLRVPPVSQSGFDPHTMAPTLSSQLWLVSYPTKTPWLSHLYLDPDSPGPALLSAPSFTQALFTPSAPQSVWTLCCWDCPIPPRDTLFPLLRGSRADSSTWHKSVT